MDIEEEALAWLVSCMFKSVTHKQREKKKKDKWKGELAANELPFFKKIAGSSFNCSFKKKKIIYLFILCAKGDKRRNNKSKSHIWVGQVSAHNNHVDGFESYFL